MAIFYNNNKISPVIIKEIIKNTDSLTILNVKELGCVGDGVTNDLPKLKEIFASVKNNTKIYFPEGTYLLGDGSSAITTTLEIRELDNVHIVGAGMTGTTVDSPGTHLTKILIHPQTSANRYMGAFEIRSCTNSSLADLEIDGNSIARHTAFYQYNIDNNILDEKTGQPIRNWGDLSEMNRCSNIEIRGGKNIIISNVYTHHPVMDCITVGAPGGAGAYFKAKNVLIENCILYYGYRQGLSIIGCDESIMRNCKISYTSQAISPIDSQPIGTLPKAGIDSETWGTNYDWLIEKCEFVDNYLNLNDGTVRFTFRNNLINNSDFYSETPSNGTRTYDIDIINNVFINTSGCNLQSRGINIENNTYHISPTKAFSIKLIGNTETIINSDSTVTKVPVYTYDRGASNYTVKGNIFRIAQTGVAGEYTFKNDVIYPYMDNDVVITNNVFEDCIFNSNTNSTNISNNSFKITDPSYVFTLTGNYLAPYKFNKYSIGFAICDEIVKTNSIVTSTGNYSGRIKLFSTDITTVLYKDARYVLDIDISHIFGATKSSVSSSQYAFKAKYRSEHVQYTGDFAGKTFDCEITTLKGFNQDVIPLLSPIYIENGYYYTDILNRYNGKLEIKSNLRLTSVGAENTTSYTKDMLILESYDSFKGWLTGCKAYNPGATYAVDDIVYFTAYGSMHKAKCTVGGAVGSVGLYSPSIKFKVGDTFTIGAATFIVDSYLQDTLTQYKNYNFNLYNNALSSEDILYRYSYVKWTNGFTVFNTTLLKNITYYNTKWYDQTGTAVTL